MLIKPPSTLEDFINIKVSILELLNNPWADEGMKVNLEEKLKKVESKIEELI